MIRPVKLRATLVFVWGYILLGTVVQNQPSWNRPRVLSLLLITQCCIVFQIPVVSDLHQA